MNPKFQKLEAFYEEELFAIVESVFTAFLNELIENKEYSRFRDFLFRSKENPILLGNYDTSNHRPSKTMVAADKIRKEKLYVEEHYGRAIRLKEVSDIVGYSECTFSHFFKQKTGQSL